MANASQLTLLVYLNNIFMRMGLIAKPPNLPFKPIITQKSRASEGKML
jgi:hypothetical protein